MAPVAADNINLETWESFVHSEYLFTTPACNLCMAKRHSKACNNYFCVECKEGSLCPEEFKIDGSHFPHRASKVQVRKSTYLYIVQCEDVKEFLDTSLVQSYLVNQNPALFLRTKTNHKDPTSASRKLCKGCLRHFDLPKKENLKILGNSAQFCSIECLIKYRKGIRQPVHKNDQNAPKDGDLELLSKSAKVRKGMDQQNLEDAPPKRRRKVGAKPIRSPLYSDTPQWLTVAESIVRREAEMACTTRGRMPSTPPAQAAPLAAAEQGMHKEDDDAGPSGTAFGWGRSRRARSMNQQSSSDVRSSPSSSENSIYNECDHSDDSDRESIDRELSRLHRSIKCMRAAINELRSDN